MNHNIYADMQDNTRKCFAVVIDGITLFFSYETLIGAHTIEKQMRIENTWGPTTGKHINRLGMSDFTIVSEDELIEEIVNALYKQAIETVNKRVMKKG